MVDTIQPVQDLFGLGRLAQSIRARRQEDRQTGIDQQQAETRGLQQQGLRLGIQQQELSIANLAKSQQLQNDLLAEIGKNPGVDPDRVAIEFFATRDPAKASEIQDKIFTRTGQLAKINPQAAVDLFNLKTGSDLKFQGKKQNLLEIGSAAAGKIMLFDTESQSVVKEFTFDKDDKDTNLQLKEGVDAQGNPAFGLFNPKTGLITQTGPGFRPKLDSGESIEISKDGTVKIIKGGLQKQKFEEKKKIAEVKRLDAKRQALDKINLVVNKVDEALANTDLFTSGLLGSTLGIIPGTPARDLKGSIDTIKANLGFTALQQMRAASPTGGALGQVSERELTLLNSAVASLDSGQSPEALRRNLEQVKTHFQNWKDAIDEDDRRRAFDEKAESNQETQTGNELNFDEQGNIIQ